MSDGYAHKRQLAGRAVHKPTPTQPHLLAAWVRARDSRDWHAPAQADYESECVAGRAARRASFLPAFRGLPPPSLRERPREVAASVLEPQTSSAIRASEAFHRYCRPRLASRDRECDPRSPPDLLRRQLDRRRGGLSLERFAADP